ncbi:MAG: glycosyl transferase, partial [Marinobacter sp.]|nr:glycosyl transferase [Marinobacter sp.]
MLTNRSRPRDVLQGLVIAGLGMTLLASDILAAAIVVLVTAGLLVSYRQSLPRLGWDKPRELRLMHFAFWFFVLISTLAWALR